jgi:hypothetical protein
MVAGCAKRERGLIGMEMLLGISESALSGSLQLVLGHGRQT